MEMTQAKIATEKLLGMMDYTTPAQRITWVVRKYAKLVGDDDTAKNFSTAGMETNEEAVGIAIVTIEYLSFWEK